MKGLDRRTRFLLAAAAALVGLNLGLFLLVVQPARARIRQEEAQVQELRGRVRRLQREGRAEAALFAAWRQAEEFRAGFPSRASLVDFLAGLTRLANRVAVEVPSVKYQPGGAKEREGPDGRDGLVRLTISMGVEGTYPRIRRFIYELEKMRRHLVIEELNLQDPRGANQLQLKLTMAAYFREDEG